MWPPFIQQTSRHHKTVQASHPVFDRLIFRILVTDVTDKPARFDIIPHEPLANLDGEAVDHVLCDLLWLEQPNVLFRNVSRRTVLYKGAVEGLVPSLGQAVDLVRGDPLLLHPAVRVPPADDGEIVPAKVAEHLADAVPHRGVARVTSVFGWA